MRTAVQIGVAYLTLLALVAVWRLAPVPLAMPDAVALFAVYLGLTARSQLAPSVLGAVAIGYLADLLMGSPRGALALDAGLLCLFAHVIHRRLLVRGMLLTVMFTAVVGLVSGALQLAIRAYVGGAPGPWAQELGVLVASAALTGAAGPLVFRLCRLVDARFARTQRHRLAALEGLP